MESVPLESRSKQALTASGSFQTATIQRVGGKRYQKQWDIAADGHDTECDVRRSVSLLFAIHPPPASRLPVICAQRVSQSYD